FEHAQQHEHEQGCDETDRGGIERAHLHWGDWRTGVIGSPEGVVNSRDAGSGAESVQTTTLLRAASHNRSADMRGFWGAAGLVRRLPYTEATPRTGGLAMNRWAFGMALVMAAGCNKAPAQHSAENERSAPATAPCAVPPPPAPTSAPATTVAQAASSAKPL